MNRRNFIKDSSFLAFASTGRFTGLRLVPGLMDDQNLLPNPNLADPKLGAKVNASSHVADPPEWLPWGYGPANALGDNPFLGWQSTGEAVGAWIEIDFGQIRQVGELWLQVNPMPTDIVGQYVYLTTFPRDQWRMAPSKIRVSLSSGSNYTFELRQASYFQILALPKSEQASSVRITIEGVLPKAGGKETGLGKVRVFSQRHPHGFDVSVHQMYDVHEGKAVQAATLTLVNPGAAITTSEFRVSAVESAPMRAVLEPIPSSATVQQDVWIPAPFENSEMEFQVLARTADFCCKRTLQVPSYHSYFNGGSFELNCTNHNDLGFLDTQEKTADVRSSSMILPALELIRQNPEFVYTMECSAYLMEFLDRHPEKRDEIAEFMRQGRFAWGASYVEMLEVSAGPEKLVRQFYFGRRWLKKAFPGVDTHLYFQTDPPSMSLQMPQILAKAGVKYCLLGRLPFGFYNWQSPDGSMIFTYGYRYGNPLTLLNPKDHSGWLQYAAQRESYYSAHKLPNTFLYDYTIDYLPPQPALIPYVKDQNKSMEAFAAVWNTHFASDKSRHIDPPRMSFTTPEKFLDRLTAHSLDIPTLRGDWPLSWTYYDEPSHREALLDGRNAHNDLLSAERLYAGLGLSDGFSAYPAQDFETAWKANVWPDHGWGGNYGVAADQVYADSYAKSKAIAGTILSGLGMKISGKLPITSNEQIPVAVFNQLSWMRTDIVECNFSVPAEWSGWVLIDDSNNEVTCELLDSTTDPAIARIAFIARDVPPVGYKCFHLKRSDKKSGSSSALTGNTLETDLYRLTFGSGGMKSLYDKKRKWEVLRTDKFEGGEVLQLTAPGQAWEEAEGVGMQDFDRTGNHDFRFTRLAQSPVRLTAVREADFSHFKLRETFHLYRSLDRVDVEIEIANWDGSEAKELRVVFPINVDEARLSYDVPFGTVEIGKDEIDFSQLSSQAKSRLFSNYYGGNHAIAFREAINWVDSSSPSASGMGCLSASDSSVHVFQDETDNPVSYPVLQHILLSVRKSLGWNPEYYFTQKGDHKYRMALLPHSGNWRNRHREAIGFNYRLIAFVEEGKDHKQRREGPSTQSYLQIHPENLILTAMKKSEDDDRIVLRFYEAEGNRSTARIKFAVPVSRAWKTSLIEEDEEVIQPLKDGSIELQVGPWEIVTLKVAV